jgi:hypothetical protein
MPKTLIGIDPDTEKNGVACLTSGKPESLELFSFDFFETLDFIKAKDPDVVYISAGWLHKANFNAKSKNLRVQARIGQYIGANHQVGKLIQQFCEKQGIHYLLIIPTQSKVVEHDYFCAIAGKKFIRTNQDQRDAAMLIIGR